MSLRVLPKGEKEQKQPPRFPRGSFIAREESFVGDSTSVRATIVVEAAAAAAAAYEQHCSHRLINFRDEAKDRRSRFLSLLFSLLLVGDSFARILAAMTSTRTMATLFLLLLLHIAPVFAFDPLMGAQRHMLAQRGMWVETVSFLCSIAQHFSQSRVSFVRIFDPPTLNYLSLSSQIFPHSLPQTKSPLHCPQRLPLLLLLLRGPSLVETHRHSPNENENPKEKRWEFFRNRTLRSMFLLCTFTDPGVS